MVGISTLLNVQRKCERCAVRIFIEMLLGVTDPLCMLRAVILSLDSSLGKGNVTN